MRARCARADEARRLLQLADLQRRRGRPRGRARRPDGKPLKDDLHGRRPACPVFVKDGEPCDLSPLEARRERRAVRAAGRPAHLHARPRPVGRMLLNGGTLDGVRILSPQSVETLLDPGLALRRQQRRDRGERLLLQLRPRDAADPHPGARLRRRHGHARRDPRRPCRRRLRHEERPLDRPRARPRHRLFRHRRPRDAQRDDRSAFTAAEARAFRRTYALLPRKEERDALDLRDQICRRHGPGDRLPPRRARARAQVRVALLDRVRDRRDGARASCGVGRA